jgi:outer membrane cobalamin receptor
LYTSYQLDQMPPKTTIEKLSNYTLVHLKLNYQLIENLHMALGIENLFNESYQILKGYLMPGRTVFSNLALSF